MNCFTHKNIVAVGVCRTCGAGVCDSCAKTLPALCPDCKIAAAQKTLKKLAQNNRIMLYIGLFFAALLLAFSYIVYLNNENPLSFLINAPTLILVLIFLLIYFGNKKKKQVQREKILAATELKSLVLHTEGLTKDAVQEMISVAVAEITSKLQVPKPAVEKEQTTSQPPPPPKEEIKEKNNPFIPAKPKSTPRQKSTKKLWLCDCGKENPTSKLFCMECGLKRTKEMLQNAKEVE